MELSTPLIHFHPADQSLLFPSNRSHSFKRTLAMAMAPHDDYNIGSSSSTATRSIPKMEPFNRSRLSRSIREPSLIEKAEHAISGTIFTVLTSLHKYKIVSQKNTLFLMNLVYV